MTHSLQKRLDVATQLAVGAGRAPAPYQESRSGKICTSALTMILVGLLSATLVGGGVVGCEYACIFAALGVRVTIVTSRTRLLAHLDPEVSDALRQQMTARHDDEIRDFAAEAPL